jgi:hypothetical protein
MKRALLLVLSISLVATPAFAAPKVIPAGLGSIYSAPIGSEAMVISGKNSIFFRNLENASADVEVIALDQGQNQVWNRLVDSGVDEIAMAMAVDPLGNIWLSGALSLAAAVETATPTTGIDNPDNVVLDNPVGLRPDMKNIGVWKLSSTGDLIATYHLALPAVPVVNSISVTNSALSIVGAIDSKPFILTSTTSGTFGKITYIASAKSELNVVVRNPDGSSTIYGSSAETVAGKKVAGIRDGLLIKVSKTGAITSLVRSSANKGSRSWISGDASFLTSGPVIIGKSTETAMTKFTSKFIPVWTLRLPSSGASQSLSANGNSYVAFTSRSAIPGISQWKPTKPSLIVLTFDSKGVIKAATALPGLVKPLALHYSTTRGVVGLASAIDGTVSIFTLVSR